MSESKSLLYKRTRAFLWILVIAAVFYLILQNITVFMNIVLVLLGFGAVVLVHEFGHFVISKLSGIKVEAFSIFMPPTLLGLRKTENGFRFRILPSLLDRGNGDADRGLAESADGAKGSTGETEYRIGLIPFGGFVKLLGQDDIGPVKKIDDPRSFSNKPVSIRIPVIAAGVTFNVISAGIIFIIVFLAGIRLPPAVVGSVVPDSPAARAGIKPGDEIIEIDGKRKDLDFSNILIASALSDVDEVVQLTVRHEDGSQERLGLVAELMPGESIREFGIIQPLSLTIADVSDPNALLEKTGLLPGDHIKSVLIDGRKEDVQTYWQLMEMVQNALVPKVTLIAERTDKDKKKKLVESQIGIEWVSGDTGHIYSMVPRFRMEEVNVSEPTRMKIVAKISRLLERIGIKQQMKKKPFLQSGDVILGVGKVANPTGEEFSDTVKKCEDSEIPIKVLRTDANGVERQHTINVSLKRDMDVNEARIGILYFRMYDFKHPVVAETITVKDGPPKLEIPRGATITAVGGVSVSNFYDIIREIKKHAGERITIDWQTDPKTAGQVALNVDADKDFVTFKPTLAEFIPFKNQEKLYRATGPVNAIGMGYRRTVMFVAQTYVTLKRLIGGLISPKNLIGPVGIIAVSYQIVVEQPLVNYAYFLGLISACIAVINLLPLPPFDGGLIVLMLIEKVKGSAVSERVQGIVAYTGWVLVGMLFLYVTFNDIVRNFLS